MDLLRRSTYHYDLPEELIAQSPTERRDACRLMVLDKQTGEIEHKKFFDVIDYLQPGDCLVINNTRVIPARLYGHNPRHAGEVETLLLRRVPSDGHEDWECLTKPGKKTKVGDKIVFSDELSGTVTELLDDGKRLVRFEFDGIFMEILERVGNVPLPPYITKKLDDAEKYQTVYSQTDGSAAAPTAGLHFTPELLQKLEQKGVKIVRVLLHVGLGTFRPVKEDDLSHHIMHSEYMKVTQEAADAINAAHASGHKVFGVGTTSVRSVETASDADGTVHAYEGETAIFIHPPYRFKAIDGMITNFHLPESTLIMMVSAFAGYDNIMNAYNLAVKERYRFFSFGDAMLLK